MYTYLLLNFFTLLFPVALSFDKKVHFFRNWLYALYAIIPVGIVFIIWDFGFTHLGIWEFNHRYVVGPEFLLLPVEEWLFFLTVPFACIFIYEVLINYLRPNLFPKLGRGIAYTLGIILLILGITHYNLLYTAVTFLSTGILLVVTTFALNPQYLSMFFLTYVVHLFPFFIVNGILTALPVVSYNDAENLGFRIGTIPVEDTIYSMLLIFLNILLYEYFKCKKSNI